MKNLTFSMKLNIRGKHVSVAFKGGSTFFESVNFSEYTQKQNTYKRQYKLPN